MNRRSRFISIVALAISFAWAYWDTIRELVATWEREPDYSHGFLVVPFALGFLWVRRSDLPRISPAPNAWGIGLIVVSVVFRWVGLRYAFDSFDGYSMIIWLSGAVLLVGGRQLFFWTMPAVLFLFFMVPLPFQVERLLSVPLQRVATALSCFSLQCLGQPAFAEGTTILLGTHELHVEQACSGMRIFVGAFALAFAYLIASRRELWEQALLLCCVVPIALVANASRITITGLLYRYATDSEVAQKFNHDSAGWVMILIAATLFALTQRYLMCLVRQVEVMRLDDLVTRNRVDA
ncbi:MAG: exosortase/archaeosortase family protein [Pirellulaceae bacterium]|nr:exosortase/archaeosortase family protein [Pirellulaceae bacterium]